MVINNHNQCSEIRQGNFWGLIFCRGSFYGFVGSPHAKRNVVNHLIFQLEFPVFPHKGSGTPDLWTLSFSSVMFLYARSRYICLDLVNGVWIKSSNKCLRPNNLHIARSNHQATAKNNGYI